MMKKRYYKSVKNRNGWHAVNCSEYKTILQRMLVQDEADVCLQTPCCEMSAQSESASESQAESNCAVFSRLSAVMLKSSLFTWTNFLKILIFCHGALPPFGI